MRQRATCQLLLSAGLFLTSAAARKAMDLPLANYSLTQLSGRAANYVDCGATFG